MIDEVVKTLAPNALLAPVLIWFMLQYANLVRQMMDNQKEMSKVMAEVRDVLRKCGGPKE